MSTAYIAANTLESLSMRVARRTRRGAPLVSAAEQLRTSLCLIDAVPVRDREIYLVATRRIVRSCARAWLAARRAGIALADEHHAAREALVRVLADTPPPTLTRRPTRRYASASASRTFAADVEPDAMPPTLAGCVASQRGSDSPSSPP